MRHPVNDSSTKGGTGGKHATDSWQTPRGASPFKKSLPSSLSIQDTNCAYQNVDGHRTRAPCAELIGGEL